MRLLLAAFLLCCCSLSSAAEPVRIPLVAGLTRVDAVQEHDGDQEQVMSVTQASADFVDFQVEFRRPSAKPPTLDARARRVRRADMASSNRLNITFQPGDSHAFPGSTLAQLSSATLAQLKQVGKAPMVFGFAPVAESPLPSAPGFVEVPTGRKYYRGTLLRDTARPASVRVVVNGRSVLLPVVNARGAFSLGSESFEVALSVLDDPAHPLLLALRQGKRGGTTVRIDFPTAKPKASQLATALEGGACRVELSGIYFDFASATLLAQSQPALRAAAEVMRTHPAWRVRIEGHTDSVGSAAFNQGLSQRRAAAVVSALSSSHKVPAERLSSAGFGASRPVASNTTLDGRAANRRVELSRTCP